MSVRTILFAALSFIFSVILWMRFSVPVVIFLVFFFVGLSLYVKIFKKRLPSAITFTIIIAAFILGSFVCYVNLNFQKQNDMKLCDSHIIRVLGKVQSIKEGDDATVVVLKSGIAVCDAKKYKFKKIKVYLNKTQDIKCGAGYIINGIFYMPKSASNEGGFDTAIYYRAKEISGTIVNASVIRQYSKCNYFADALYNFRKKIEAGYDRIFDSNDASLAKAIVLGQKNLLEDEIKQLYQDAGIAHLMAVSGLHVTFFAMLINGLLTWCNLPRKISAIISIAVCICYVSMIGGGVSALRALIMFIILTLSEYRNRRYDTLVALSISGAIELFINPNAVWDIGFIFSYFSIVGIIFISREVIKKMNDDDKHLEKLTRKTKIIISLKKSFIVSLSIQIMLMPIQMYVYYQVPLLSTLLNILILPFSSVLLASLSLAAVLSAAGADIIANYSAILAKVILNMYEKLCQLSLKIPFNQVISGKTKVVILLIIYLIIMLGVFLIKYTKIRRRVIIAAMYLSTILGVTRADKKFELDILDVGQGDGIYLRCDKNHNIFIDGGSTSVSNVGKYCILPFLKSKAIRHIDYWFVSHSDNDHISGLIEVIQSGYKINNIVFAKAMKKESKIADIALMASQNDINVIWAKANDSIKWDEGRIDVIFPDGDKVYEDPNDGCLSVLIRYKDFSGLFCGDIGIEQEEEIADKYDISHLDFFKADHHGSKYSNSEIMLKEMEPKICTISYQEGNSYGHPHKEALNRIKEYALRIYKTGASGQIKITQGLKQDSYRVWTMNR